MTRFAITGLLLLGVLFGEPKVALADTITVGFVDTGGVFTTLEFPGTENTYPTGINDSGQIVGYTRDNSGLYQSFIYSAGVFTTLSVPGGTSTIAKGINDSGQIVGTFSGPLGDLQGFVYSPGGQTPFTPFNVPGANGTGPYGISNSGEIMGVFYQGNIGSVFLYSAGVFTTLDVPGQPTGINDSGQILGMFPNQLGGESGFVDTGGVITTVTFPGVASIGVSGINDSGQIVGWLPNQLGGVSGFVDTGGVFTTVNFPGVQGINETSASGINDNGQIVGSALFLAPEPSYLIPLCFGMVTLVLALRGRTSDKRQTD